MGRRTVPIISAAIGPDINPAMIAATRIGGRMIISGFPGAETMPKGRGEPSPRNRRQLRPRQMALISAVVLTSPK